MSFQERYMKYLKELERYHAKVIKTKEVRVNQDRKVTTQSYIKSYKLSDDNPLKSYLTKKTGISQIFYTIT